MGPPEGQAISMHHSHSLSDSEVIALFLRDVYLKELSRASWPEIVTASIVCGLLALNSHCHVSRLPLGLTDTVSFEYKI